MSTAPVLTRPPERSSLERLDAAVVPRLQAGARTTVTAVGAPLQTVARAEEAVAGGAVRWAVAHRRGLRLVVAIVAVVGATVHFVRYPQIQQAAADRAAAAAEQTVSEPGRIAGSGGALAGGSQIIGPATGTAVRPYIAQRHADLEAVPPQERRIAVVSLRAYVTAAEALAAVPDGATIHAAQLRIPAVGEEPFQTEVVANDLLGSVERALGAPMAAFADEEAALRDLIPSVTDPEFRADYQERLEQLQATRNLVNSGAGTVFALVVEAPAGQLQALLDLDVVRLVDVAPGETSASGSGFVGLLPEDSATVSRGVDA